MKPVLHYYKTRSTNIIFSGIAMQRYKMTTSRTDGDTVLVTGGAGFLGQHIVSMLQTNAPHVKEIRVLDLNPYINKLGHSTDKDFASITGSVTDTTVLAKALRGVDSVIHVAGKISYGTFPDFEGMQKVNVEGTNNLIKACLENDVTRLIFCSTVDVVIGHNDIINGNESNTTTPTTFLFPGYPESKYRAECSVLAANGFKTQTGKELRTVSLRANVMYGEGDPYYITSGLRNARNADSVLYQIGDGNALFQPAYAGNSAWAFVCADKALKTDSEVGGKFYYIPDDTRPQNTFKFMKPFLASRGYKLSAFSLPYKLVYSFLYIAEIFVKLLSPFTKVPLPAESYSVKYINMNLYFNGEKARKELNYKPMFSPEEAMERSWTYYKSVKL